jgi:hypothetical protein
MKKLPPLGRGVELCAGISSVMSAAARAAYREAARAQIDEADNRVGTTSVPHPVSDAHELAGNFLLAAGDFVHGIHAVLRQELDLAYSTGSMARSACEYAAKGWWLLEPGIDEKEQVCRMLGTLRAAVGDEERLEGASAELDDVKHACDELERASSLSGKRGMPPTQQLLERMAPGDGQRHWRHLCATVHGGVFSMLRVHQSVMQEHPIRQYEEWFRVIVAGGYGLQAAVNRAQLSGSKVEHLDEVVALHAYWHGKVDAWLESRRSP